MLTFLSALRTHIKKPYEKNINVLNSSIRQSNGITSSNKPWKVKKNIKINTPVESFQEIITTTSSYTIYDKDNIEKNSQEILKSGDYLLIGNNKYIIYVLGDIRGVGTYNKDDLKEMAKHIIDKNILTINQIYSADYNNDGLLKMNDVLNLLKELNSQNN